MYICILYKYWGKKKTSSNVLILDYVERHDMKQKDYMTCKVVDLFQYKITDVLMEEPY